MTQSTCSIEDCGDPSRARGWCEMHYARWRAHGDPLVVLPRSRPRIKERCAVEGCDRAENRKGYCDAHYRRARKGMPLEAQIRRFRSPICEVPGCGLPHCSGGFCAMHWQRNRIHGDPGEAERRVAPAGSGTIRSGYRVVRRDGRDVMEHREAMEALLGRPLERHETVHHVNGQRDDNTTDGPLRDYRSGNLELWSTWQPAGQRVGDKIEFAVDLLRTYRPDLLVEAELRTGSVGPAGSA